MLDLPLVRLDLELPVPAYARDGDAGADLFAREDVLLVAGGGRAVVPTGVAVAIPDGHAGLVLPRSGLALKSGIALVNSPGLIDPGYRGEIRTHVAVLSDLVDDLFELARIEAGDISWTMRQVELRDLIGDTVAAMRAPAAERGVTIAAELPPGEVIARANAEKVQRVLFNLIQNAIRHTPADGSVTVRARSAGRGVEVEVADSGEGISDADGERVFEAFYRGDAARGEDGAGLGLAISRAIVEAHGGKIWLEDGSPGTRVHFTLQGA